MLADPGGRMVTFDPDEVRDYLLGVGWALVPTAGFSALAWRARRGRAGDRPSAAERILVVLAECAASVLITVLLWPLR